MSYITGKQAQLIIGITTRQGLHKIAKEHIIETKSQGAGKPNLYLESDVKLAAKKVKSRIKKFKPKLEKKILVKKQKIIENVENLEEQHKEADKKLQDIRDKQKEDIDVSGRNPLNEIGQSEFLRVEQILIKNGTYQPLDRAILLSYCISYQKYIDAVVRSEESDNCTMDDIGNLRVHPYFTISKDCLTQMIKLSNVLGIGVRNRVGLDIKKEKKVSVFDMMKEDEKFD